MVKRWGDASTCRPLRKWKTGTRRNWENRVNGTWKSSTCKTWEKRIWIKSLWRKNRLSTWMYVLLAALTKFPFSLIERITFKQKSHQTKSNGFRYRWMNYYFTFLLAAILFFKSRNNASYSSFNFLSDLLKESMFKEEKIFWDGS